MTSLRASATIIVLRVLATAVGGASLIPHCQGAALLKPQKAPSELDHTTTDPGVAGSGEPLFPSLRATLVRRPRQAGVARHRFDPVEIGLSETNRYQFSNRRVIQHRIRIGRLQASKM